MLLTFILSEGITTTSFAFSSFTLICTVHPGQNSELSMGNSPRRWMTPFSAATTLSRDFRMPFVRIALPRPIQFQRSIGGHWLRIAVLTRGNGSPKWKISIQWRHLANRNGPLHGINDCVRSALSHHPRKRRQNAIVFRIDFSALESGFRRNDIRPILTYARRSSVHLHHLKYSSFPFDRLSLKLWSALDCSAARFHMNHAPPNNSRWLRSAQ